MKRIFSKASITNEQKVVDLLACTVEQDGCRIWTRCFNTDGYARMRGNVKVHRLMYELSHPDEDIKGRVVRHTCDNPKCINPDHLLSGTPADNAKDRDERGRAYRVITVAHIKRTKELLSTKKLFQREIALIVGIDTRRVSDISLNKYSDDGRFLGH